MNRGWGSILPALRWLYLIHPISDQPMGLGFPHRAERYRPGRTSYSAISLWVWGFHTVRGGVDPRGSSLSSPGCRGCRDKEGFMNRGWGSILPAWRWLHPPHPIIDQRMGLGLPHRAERCRPRRTDFRPRVGGVVETWKDVWTGDGALSSPVAAGLGGLPRGAASAARPAPHHCPSAGREVARPIGLGFGKRRDE